MASDSGPPRKRRRLNEAKKKRMTKAQFMSQPLAAFIDNDSESHFDIAEKIVTFFEDRDAGDYAAIVADQKIDSAFTFSDGKYRECTDCRGRYICVWKQPLSETLSTIYSDENVRSVVKGLIMDNHKCSDVCDALDELLGDCWVAVSAPRNVNTGYVYTFDDYQVDDYRRYNKVWEIWRAPEK